MKLYKIISIFLFPIILICMIIRLIKNKENLASITQKFVLRSDKCPKNKLVIWFHAASVGEVNMAIPIIKTIIDERADVHCLITTITLTSAKIFKSANIKNTTHQFLPIDVTFFISRFLAHWNPKVAVFIESEIWPNLIDATTKKIPLLLYNARLSETSFNRWYRYKDFTSSLLQRLSLIFTASNLDYERYNVFTKNNLKFIGHFKYSSPPLTYSSEYVQTTRTKLKNKNIFVVASTHKGEEEIIIKLHKEIKEKIPNIFTVIIPRHPKRIEEIISMAEKYKLRYVTDIDNYNNHETELLLVSSFGVLGNYFEISDIVFIGGSLVNIGGHNIIEPAKQGCAIIVGPHTSNFKDIIDDFKIKKAIVVARDYDELKCELLKLFNDSSYKNQLIANSNNIIASQKNISKIAIDTIYNYMK